LGGRDRVMRLKEARMCTCGIWVAINEPCMVWPKIGSQE
jgi:hypothetical protein